MLAVDDVLTHRTRVNIEVPPPGGLFDPTTIPIAPLLDDGVLFAICKQPNLPVQPRGENDMDNVISALHSQYRSDDPTKDRVPYLAHRLDADTSGVLLLLWVCACTCTAIFGSCSVHPASIARWLVGLR